MFRSREPWRHRRLVGSLTATIGANLPAFLTGSLAVQLQRELDFGDAQLGVAVGGFYAAGAVCSPFAGRLVGRFGAQRSLRTAALLSGLAQLLIASVAESYAMLVLLVALGGLANAWAQPASNVYLIRIVPAHRLGLALGLQKSAIPAAALLGGLAVPFARDVGWRWAFVAGAAFAALAAMQVPAEPRPEVEVDHGGGDGRAGREGALHSSTRSLMVLALGVGLGSSASNALSAFIVRAGVHADLDETHAALLLTVGSVLGIAVRLFVGHRADLHPGRALRSIACLFVAAAASFLLLATQVDWVFVIATPLAFSTGYAWPGLFHLAVVRSNPSAPGTATGIAMTGTLAGAVAGPVLFGAIAEHVGFGAAWVTAAAFLAVAAIVVTWAGRHIVEQPLPAPLLSTPSAPGTATAVHPTVSAHVAAGATCDDGVVQFGP